MCGGPCCSPGRWCGRVGGPYPDDPGSSTDLDGKLLTFDAHAPGAVDYLIRWLETDRDALIALAKGRHVEGHYRFRDGLMYEYDADTLKAEASQELADAINYIARRLDLTT